MQQIAAAAGVSVTTVSHTISGKRPVRPATAERIRRLIEEFGYVPDSGARRLKTGRSHIIGLAVPDVSHWYFGRVARGVEEAADARDYGVIIVSTANSDPRREKRHLNMLRTRVIDGLVYTASREMIPTDELANVATKAPVVLADEAIPSLTGVPSVTSDNLTGARALGAHLAALGHRKAVILTGFSGLKSQIQRVTGIRDSFPHALVLAGDFEIASGYALVSDLLAQEAQFTALVGCNDLMAIRAIQRLREAGLRVPEDVSVVGFDDVEMASVVTPGLTTVRQDALEIGRRAGTLLLDALTGTTPLSEATSVTLPVELIVRGSTGPAPD